MTMLAKLTDEALAGRVAAAEQLLAEAEAMHREYPSLTWSKRKRNRSAALGRLRREQKRRAEATPHVSPRRWLGRGSGLMSAARPLPSLTTRQKWELYEQEKARLQALGLAPTDYEKAIRNLTMRLRL